MANPESELSTHKISDSLYVVLGGGGQGSHVGVSVGDKNIVLVDSMVTASNKKLLAAINAISDKPVRYVINTHSHSDHTGGNTFLEENGATIISHVSSIHESSNSHISFSDGITVSDGTERIDVVHASSHSASDAIVYFKKSNVVFMGDVFTTGWYPAFFHGGLSGQNEAIEIALSLADESTLIVPGHGEISNRRDLSDYKDASNLWVNRIMELHNTGMKIEGIIKDRKLNEIREKFKRPNTNQKDFDKWFNELVKNTVMVESALANP